jgi:peroxiredoxin
VKAQSTGLALVLSMFVAVSALPGCNAQNTTVQNTNTKAQANDPAGLALLKQVCKFYAGLNTLSYDVSTEQSHTQGSDTQKKLTKYTVKVGRPASFALDVESTKADEKLKGRLNNSDFFVYVPTKGYIKQPASKVPADTRVAADLTGLVAREVSLFGMISALSSADPMAILSDCRPLKLDQVAITGEEKIDGAATKKLTLITNGPSGLEWSIWAEPGDKPWVHRAVASLKVPQQNADLCITTNFSNWKDNPKFESDTFTFVPPAGAKEVKLEEAGGEDAAAQIKGKAAPPVQLSTVSGGTFNLADSKGKEVVVLDFWATWCPPCRRALPILSKVTSAYAAKGVKFVAIDLGEEAAKVQAFLKAQGLNVNVALDHDGAVAKTYGVNGIPQSVIINKDGIVKVVHVGFAPNLEEILPRELDAVLQGKEPSQ